MLRDYSYTPRQLALLVSYTTALFRWTQSCGYLGRRAQHRSLLLVIAGCVKMISGRSNDLFSSGPLWAGSEKGQEAPDRGQGSGTFPVLEMSANWGERFQERARGNTWRHFQRKNDACA